MNKVLMDATARRKKRIIVNMPPRHGKSELISKYFPFWYLGNNPDDNLILTSYNDGKAAEWGMVVRDFIEDYGKEYFNLTLKKSSKAKKQFQFRGCDGGFQTAGVGGSITGKGADVLIIDDPIKDAKTALSKTERESIWEWYKGTAYTRLSPKGVIIIVMTRWHYDDLVGKILRNSTEDWEVIDFPAIATNEDILGRKPGDALWPKQYSINALRTIQAEIGERWFSSEYQQEPIANEHVIFNPEWWLTYDDRTDFDMIYQVWDTAFKEGQQNDYSVSITFGINSKGIHILNMWRGKLTYPKLKAKMIELHSEYKANRVFVEDSASGQALIPDIRQNHPDISIKGIESGNKVVRANLVSSIVEKGMVYLPKDAHWKTAFINELSQFPSAPNDDIVDAFTLNLKYFAKLSSSFSQNTTRTHAQQRPRDRDIIANSFMGT
jgi:predicted phage terminase large subunit-like protein